MIINFPQVKVKSMKSYEERVKKLIATAKKLRATQLSPEDSEKLQISIDKFIKEWDELLKK